MELLAVIFVCLGMIGLVWQWIHRLPHNIEQPAEPIRSVEPTYQLQFIYGCRDVDVTISFGTDQAACMKAYETAIENWDSGDPVVLPLANTALGSYSLISIHIKKG